MSEPSSFYAKIKIGPENFKKFLAAKPAITKTQSGWQEWWNSKDMHGKTELKEINLYEYENENNEEIINGWLNSDQTYSFSDYDAEHEIWHF